MLRWWGSLVEVVGFSCCCFLAAALTHSFSCFPQAPHTPIEVPAFYSNRARELIPNPPPAVLASAPISSGGEANRWYRYAGMILCADEAIGNITAALKRNDLFEDTMVVFIGDNGAPVGETHISRLSNAPFKGGKASLFEGGVRTPAIVAGGRWVADMMREPLQSEDKPRDGGDGNDNNKSADDSTHRASSRLIHIADWCPTIMDIVQRMSGEESQSRANVDSAGNDDDGDNHDDDDDDDLFGGESFLDNRERNATVTLLIRHQNYARGAAR